MKKKKKFVIALLASLLFSYMLFLFGPCEIYFANTTEFKFVFGEFIWYLVRDVAIDTIVVTLILTFIPEPVFKVLTSIIMGISIAGYIQVMFLNKGLDLLGLNPDGYKAGTVQLVINVVIWVVIIGFVIFLAFFKKQKRIWEKFVPYCAAFLLCIQVVAFVSLLVTAKEDAYKRPEGTWHLSGEEQYTVSANQNIIVLVLDYFSNQYIEPMKTAYPDLLDALNDFTYYNNMDCSYFGTFPSLPHILTGQDVNMSMTINDWCAQIWDNEETNTFYKEMQKQNYKTNLYTPDTNILCGLNNVNILQNKLSNVVDSAQEVEVDQILLVNTLMKMSAYRMFPELLKPLFYANIDEYQDVVKVKENQINHNNYDFYADLCKKGLTVDYSSNYYIMQHLMGPHLYTTDEYGVYKEDSTLEETGKGCMVIVEEYLNQLKELGVYDNATIIITADHGGGYDSQVIFFMKKPGETHDIMQETNAPASFNEFLPTIAKQAGIEDYSRFGQTIFNFQENEQRQRTVWLRWDDENYPLVPCYTGDKDGTSNVYYGYTYTGNIMDLLHQTEIGPSVIVPIADSYF